VQNYHGLKVSAKARELAILVYAVTRDFPRSELYGATDQLRRAARGVGLAIAEGCGRATNRETARYFTIANGSAQEVEFGAEQAIDLEFAPRERLEPVIGLAIELQKMLCTLIKRVHAR
jgi:four helix bundle protein